MHPERRTPSSSNRSGSTDRDGEDIEELVQLKSCAFKKLLVARASLLVTRGIATRSKKLALTQYFEGSSRIGGATRQAWKSRYLILYIYIIILFA